MVREIWFEKSGWPEKKVVFYTLNPHFFQVGEKWFTRKKNPSLKKRFSRTIFLEKWLQIKWLNSDIYVLMCWVCIFQFIIFKCICTTINTTKNFKGGEGISVSYAYSYPKHYSCKFGETVGNKSQYRWTRRENLENWLIDRISDSTTRIRSSLENWDSSFKSLAKDLWR